MKTKIKSTILLFLTAIIWGFAFVAQRVGAEFVGAFTFNGIRFFLGFLSLIPVILIFEREKTLMVGDRKFDINSACKFGLDSVGVTFGYGSKEELKSAGATYIADSAKEIENLLEI